MLSLLLPLSHVSRLFTLGSFEATPTQDGIRGVDFNRAHGALRRRSFSTEREVAVGLRKLITKKMTRLNVIQENSSALPLEIGLFFGGANGTAPPGFAGCAVSSGTWIQIKLH